MRSKITLIILVLLVLIGAGTSVFFATKYYSKNEKENQTVQQQVEQNQEVATDKENKNIAQVAEFKYDTSKTVDGKEIKWYRETLEYNGARVVITDSEMFFYFSREAAQRYNSAHPDAQATEYDGYRLVFEEGTIVQAKFLTIGGKNTDALLLVLEDGTVRYIPYNGIATLNIQVIPVEGLTDVVAVRGIYFDGGDSDNTIVYKRDGSKELINKFFK